MRDALEDFVATGLIPRARRCEWCERAAVRGRQLCEACYDRCIETLVVPGDAGHPASCCLGLYRAAAVLL